MRNKNLQTRVHVQSGTAESLTASKPRVMSDVERASYAALDAAGDFERAIRRAMRPQEALVISLRIREVLQVLQTADLLATNRMLALCGLPGEA